MQITIDYEQAKFIRDRAAARIPQAQAVMTPNYKREFLAHMPESHYNQVIAEREAEIEMLRELLVTLCQYCDYKPDGTDTDGTEWYRCQVHDELAPSTDAPCAGYIEEPYILRQLEKGDA